MSKAPVTHIQATIHIAKNAAALADLARPTIAILPDYDNWNDYGRRYYATLVVLFEDADKNIETTFRLMFADPDMRTANILDRLLTGRSVISLDEVRTPFCSLQNDAIGYDNLVKTLGFDATINALRALNDVVFAKIEGDDKATIELSESQEFHIGVIRHSGRYTALRRGGRYLRPNPLPELSESPPSFELQAELPGLVEPVVVEFNFQPDPIFDDRICVLIGKNGVGKTQLFKSLIDTMTDKEGLEPETRAATVQPSPTISRTLMFSSVPSDPYRRRIEPWWGIDYEYFSLTADSAPLGSGFIASVMDCLRDDGSEFEDTGLRNRWALFRSLLNKIGLLNGLHLPLKKDADLSEFRLTVEILGNRCVSVRQGFTEKQQNILTSIVDRDQAAVLLSSHGIPRTLSSGELAMMQFCAQAVASVERGSLLLFDEPETHLHPNYVTEFTDILQELLARTQSVAIIATHSAYVLREVPRQRVNVLYREDDSVVAGAPRMQTFGANLDELSRFVFQDGDVSPRHTRRLQQWAVETGKKIGIDQVVEEFGDQLSPVTLSLIAKTIRDDAGN